MAKIPFDIKYRDKIESGEYKLETECGHPVSIMDWEWIDRNEKKCLAVKVLMDEGFNIGYLFDYDGKRHSIFPSDSDSDLFIVTPEEELTEFEDAFGRAMMDVPEPEEKEEWYPFLKEKAAELLALAREQFIKDGYVIEKKAFHDAVENISDKHLAEMSVQYSLHCKVEDGTRHAIMNWDAFQKVAQKFIDIGKKEALKDLPRWEKCADCTPKPKYSNEWIFSIDSENVTRESAIVHKGYFLPLDGLEKLPGFKED